MIRDYWKPLLRREVRQISDSVGGFTESLLDSQIQGFIAELNGSETFVNKQLGNNATAQLLTEADLKLTDRVVDGKVVYEVVWKFESFHTRYLLKRET